MTANQPQRTPRKRPSKSITLDPETIQIVTQFANEQNLSFSRAAEVLMLLGQTRTEPLGIVLLLESRFKQQYFRYLQRIGDLIMKTFYEAGIARQMSENIFFTMVQDASKHYGAEDGIFTTYEDREYDMIYSEFEESFGVDPNTRQGFDVKRIFNKRHGRARSRTRKLLDKTDPEMEADRQAFLEEDDR